MSELIVDGESIIAEVLGTQEYHVELWVEDGGLEYDCDCPVGVDGMFCKHCVAVGLAWLEANARSEARPAGSSPTVMTLDGVRAYLRGLTPEALVEMVMEQVHHDADLREQLLLRAVRTSAQGIDLSFFRNAIDRAIAIRDFVDYGGAYSYAAGVDRVLDSLEELLQEGHAGEALMLIEYAVPAFDRAIELVDDSDGELGMPIDRLQDLHYEACVAAKPDPEALARTLFTWGLENGFLTFAVESYADLLGDSGLATFRALVEAEWERLPALGPGESKWEDHGRRWQITRMKEALEYASGDLETRVAIISRDLSTPYQFLRIAGLYQAAGRHDEALAWAERGLQAFPARTDEQLRQWLVEEYHRRGRHDDAMALIWQAFTDMPVLATYSKLQEHAERIGQWEAWRERAWTALRGHYTRRLETKPFASRYMWYASTGYSELVRILLWEGRVDEAWQEANDGDCLEDLWMQLAALRENEHPEDALTVYFRHIPPILDRTNNDAYETAIDLLHKCRTIMARLDRLQAFRHYVEKLRAEYKRKRNFIKMLDAAKWA
ncbi:MAG: SWIM zinc finger family protein [Armatimonadota bacterium]